MPIKIFGLTDGFLEQYLSQPKPVRGAAFLSIVFLSALGLKHVVSGILSWSQKGSAQLYRELEPVGSA